jgi:hypothetical protein
LDYGSYGKIKKEKTMKKNKDTYQNTLIASGEQNFQGDVTSGFVMKLIEQTLENIRYGRQSSLTLVTGSEFKSGYCLSTLLKD